MVLQWGCWGLSPKPPAEAIGGTVEEQRGRSVSPDGDSKTEEARLVLKNLEAAVLRYKLYNLNFPTTEQGLMALIVRPTTPPIPVDWIRCLTIKAISPCSVVGKLRLMALI